MNYMMTNGNDEVVNPIPSDEGDIEDTGVMTDADVEDDDIEDDDEKEPTKIEDIE